MAETEQQNEKPKSKLDIRVIALGVNLLLLLGALGGLVYTRLIFERPAITETAEMAEQKKEAKKPPPSAERVLISLEEMRINLAASQSQTAHYVSFAMNLECANEEMASKVEEQKQKIIDRIITTFNRTEFNDINTVQGRLILKELLIHDLNRIIGVTAITDIYYSLFVLQ
jgi:flagellar basal body-associated protein FliL